MAEDWLVDVRKYVPDADEGVVGAIVKYCGIALQSRDSSLVAMSDKKERDLVRENYLKKKLGLSHPDSELDEAVLAVGDVMKADRTKNRVTVYYLLAKHFGLLSVFGGAAAGVSGAAGAGAAALAAATGLGAGTNDDDGADSTAPLAAAGLAGAAGAAAAGMGAAASAAPPAAPVTPRAPEPAYAASSYDNADADADGGGMWGWLKWLLLAAVLLGLLFFLMRSCSDQSAPVSTTDDRATETSSEVAPDADTAVDGNVVGAAEEAPDATAEAVAAIPTGSGIVASTRDGKPMLKVYFDTSKTNLPADFTKVAAVIKDYAAKNPGAKFAVSGFNDPRGSAAINAELSKGRAQQVGKGLEGLGITAGSIELVPPAAATDSTASLDEARRVEVTVK